MNKHLLDPGARLIVRISKFEIDEAIVPSLLAEGR
jgi:hypothetical protein